MSEVNVTPLIAPIGARKSLADNRPVNVAQVRQLSPFRYPGGKTWLVPVIRQWLTRFDQPALFVEPFAGGGIVSLTVAMEQLAQRVLMVELDDDVSAVWATVFGTSEQDVDWLCSQILEFDMQPERVQDILARDPETMRHRAFRTILKNRVNRGGILAPGASVVKSGENHKGLKSRWYPETLVRRIQTIRAVRDRVEFRHANAFPVLQELGHRPDVTWFLDPPYTAGGKKAGARLYIHNEVDHTEMFQRMADAQGHFLMTYDNTPEVISLARQHQFHISSVLMKNTHHHVMYELLITQSESLSSGYLS